jgi:hypothetical protein
MVRPKGKPGSGNETPPSKRREIISLYCMRNEDGYTFNIDQIADITCVDRKTVRMVIRDTSTKLLQRHYLRHRA